MIEINLIEKKKKFKMPLILGMDFSALNFKMLIVAMIIYHVPDWYLTPEWKNEIQEKNKIITGLRKREKKLQREIAKNRNVEEQLAAYNRQVGKLKKRSEQVDQIIKTKSNPKLLLEKFARSMPKDLWFDTLTIDQDKKIKVEGGAISYRSIGDFIISGNNFGFFGNTLTLSNSKTVEEVLDGRKLRIQSYEITGKIETFNPWANVK